jgi:hypothetical protein
LVGSSFAREEVAREELAGEEFSSSCVCVRERGRREARWVR